MRLICDIASLNYLSAQCPFGTLSRYPLDALGLIGRLNYLSAQCPFGTPRQLEL